MSWGTVTIGGIAFREELTVEQNGTTLHLTGQESHPPSTTAKVAAAHNNVVGLNGLTVSVVFSDKADLTGFYRVSDAKSQLMKWANGAVITATWSATLERIGSERDVEIESRVPTIARSTTVTTPPAAVFWHAPAGNSTSYWTGSTVPASSIVRTSADGPLAVHLGIPSSIAPRWTVETDDYLKGSARILFDGIRRAGTATPPLTVWEVNNGLVRLMSGPNGAFTVSCWASGDWRSAKTYALAVNGAAVTGQPELTVLRNDPEEAIVRLSYPTTPGRLTVDLSIRRGCRFVTGVMKRHSAASLAVARTAVEAATTQTGGLRATSVDLDGNRFVMGSAATVTAATTTASLTKAAATTFDFFVGHEVGGSPTTGEAFADLWAQYRGSSGERASVVLR